MLRKNLVDYIRRSVLMISRLGEMDETTSTVVVKSHYGSPLPPLTQLMIVRQIIFALASTHKMRVVRSGGAQNLEDAQPFFSGCRLKSELDQLRPGSRRTQR